MLDLRLYINYIHYDLFLLHTPVHQINCQYVFNRRYRPIYQWTPTYWSCSCKCICYLSLFLRLLSLTTTILQRSPPIDKQFSMHGFTCGLFSTCLRTRFNVNHKENNDYLPQIILCRVRNTMWVNIGYTQRLPAWLWLWIKVFSACLHCTFFHVKTTIRV